MKKLFGILTFVFASFVANAQHPNTLTPKEKKQGWRLLFDGKTLNGWRNFNKKDLGPAWKISDDAIMLDNSQMDGWNTKGGGELTTDDIFENFIFSCEWKISEGGNSGIIFNAQEDDAKKRPYSWFTGPEFQVLDNDGHADGKIDKHRAGNLYDLIKYEPENVKPVGEWNKVMIAQTNGKVKLYVNGRMVIQYDTKSEEFKKLVAGSKFKDMESWGTFTKGHIVFQDHGNKVWFRNIKIKTL